MVRWQQKRDSLLFRSLLNLERGLHHAVFDQRLANSKALSLEKRVGHRAANQNFINASIDQRVDDRNLVRDFCAGEYRNKRMLRMVDCSSQIFEVFLNQQTSRSFRNVASYPA